MSSHVESETSGSMSSLMAGIVDDARQLLIQQLTLFQVEIKHDIRRALEVAIAMMAGMVTFFLAGLTLVFALAFFLSWMWPQLPVWGGFAIVGVLMAVIGVGLVLWGKSKLETFSLLPRESVEGLKENLQWKTKK